MGFPTPLMLWVPQMRSDPELETLLGAKSLRRGGVELWSRVFLDGDPVGAQDSSLRRTS